MKETIALNSYAVVVTAILAMLAAAYHAYGQIGVNGAGSLKTAPNNQTNGIMNFSTDRTGY